MRHERAVDEGCNATFYWSLKRDVVEADVRFIELVFAPPPIEGAAAVRVCLLEEENVQGVYSAEEKDLVSVK